MAGKILLRARSAVTPNRTRLQGPAILGRRLSWGSRSGFCPAETVAGIIRPPRRRRFRLLLGGRGQVPVSAGQGRRHGRSGAAAGRGGRGRPQAQPKLRTMKLYLGAETLDAELALTPKEEQTGMMFRTNIQETDAMLFRLPEPQRASF